METYLNSESQYNINNLNNMFYKFMQNKTYYYGMRIININGKEISRLDYNKGNIKIFKNNEFQVNNSDYFKNTKDLPLNSIYISPFDLSKEMGYMEPTIRFCVPLFNNQKNKVGILVLDYNGDKIIELLNQFAVNNNGYSIMLLNEDGYWIRSGYKDKDWGFMYNNKKNISFKNEFPDTWNKIINENFNNIDSPNGIYYFTTINTLTESNFNINASVKPFWKLVIYYPKEKIIGLSNLKVSAMAKIELFTIVVLALGCFVGTTIFNFRRNLTNRLKLAGKIFENSSEAILFTEKDTKITYINKAFMDITGYTEKEIIGKKTSYFKSGKHDKDFYKNMWNSINKYGKWQGEVWDRKKNGQLYPKLLTISSVQKEVDEKIKYVGIFHDISNLKEKENNINKLKNYDILTEIPNIYFFKKIIKNEIESVLAPNNKFDIICINISNYDSVRDSFGLKISDFMILEVLKRIRSIISPKHIISRTERNEFMILMGHCANLDVKSVTDLVNNILTSFETPLMLDGEIIYGKISIGISMFPKDGTNEEDIIACANLAKDYAKLEETYKYQFYEKNIKEDYLVSVKIENYLRSALEKKEFELYYQPQVDLKSEKIIGAEALIRWNNSELGRMSPTQFIPIAEKTGLIIPIGKWVIEEACRQTKIWHNKGLPKITMAVNISPVQFKRCDMINVIKNTLDENILSGNYLEVEVTEGLLLHNINEMTENIEKLKKMGVRIALDDYGTGYSSLNYLKKLKFDKLKIDREFVKDYPENDDGNIAKTVVDLSHNLGITAIAEGVETQVQLEFMKKINCDEIQGYYYSKPVNSEQFEKLLNNFERKG